MNKELKSTISVILFVVILLVSYFLVYPQWTKISAKRGELSRLRDENVQLKKTTEEFTSFVKAYKNYGEEQALASAVLPLKNDNLDTALRTLNSIAKASNITISSLVLPPKSNERKVMAENGIEPVDLNLMMSGTYPSFNYFLQLLHQNSRLFDILSIDMKSGNAGEVLQFNVKVRTYYQR